MNDIRSIVSAHTSGHAGVDDLKRIVEAFRPRVLVPIHTFEPARYKDLWGNVRLLADGDALEL